MTQKKGEGNNNYYNVILYKGKGPFTVAFIHYLKAEETLKENFFLVYEMILIQGEF